MEIVSRTSMFQLMAKNNYSNSNACLLAMATCIPL